jgi:predicted hotdog family 3-hydroxylacyl-ACP dehydratase
MALYQNISDLIPQKHPFVLVDELITCSDKITVCGFLIPENHPLVQEGKLSEGGLTENIAQTAAAGNGYQSIEKNIAIPNGFIAGIKNLKVVRLPLCNSQIKTTVTQENRVMDYNLIKGEIFQNDECIASCEMKIYCPE